MHGVPMRIMRLSLRHEFHRAGRTSPPRRQRLNLAPSTDVDGHIVMAQYGLTSNILTFRSLKKQNKKFV